MKLTTFIMIITLAQVSAKTFSQNITLEQKNVPLKSVLKSIETQSGYVFLSTDYDLDKPRINVSVKNATIEEALLAVLKDVPLTYKIVDNSIVLSKKEPSFLQNLVDRFNNIDVHGKILDSEGKVLPGASIKVKSTGKAVSTDAKGNFFLRGVEEGALLIVSFIGYLPKEVNASADMGSVVLEQSLSKLDEVQVIAYGTTTQRLSTGNVTTIKADVIEKQPVNNPLLALQGRVPGLFIEQQTGFSGTGVKVRIQGTNSIRNGNDPLYVIDGLPYSSQLLPGSNPILGFSENGAGNPLNFINPSDIESIDILKDADATAIYGSRAANGAILITTKKGKPGEIKVDANLQSGWGKVSRRLDLMNSQQYLEMRKEASKNDNIDFGVPPYNTELYKSVIYPDLVFWDPNRYTDWQKVLIGGIAQYQDIQASVSGGNSLTTFVVGAGYHKEGNVFPGNFDDVKNSVHFSSNSMSSNRKFKIQVSGSYLINTNILPSTDLTNNAMKTAPLAPSLFNENGNPNWEPSPSGISTFLNPIMYIYKYFKNTTSNLIGNGILTYEVLPKLDFKVGFGYNNINSNIVQYATSQYIKPEVLPYFIRTTIFGNSRSNSLSIEPQLNYNATIGKGKMEVLIGSTFLKEFSDATSIQASGFTTDLVMEDIKSATALAALSSINSVYKYNAVFGRINYNQDNKYILNLTARRDGSSRFGSENQFHNFGAIGAAWIFSEEHMVKEQFKFLSYGKLRGSYGTTGNDKIPDYNFLSLYYPLNVSVPYQGINGYQPGVLTNPYLQWEETKKFQVGLDLGFLKDRVLLNINYSLNRSSNQLLDYALPNATGFRGIQTNFPATLQNTGWEFTLSTVNLDKTEFKWTSSLNLTVPQNKLIKFVDFENSSYNSQYIIGKSINIQKVFNYLGVDPITGIYQFIDRNGNKTFSPIANGNPNNDATIIINPDPKYYGGFSNTFTYKGFQLDLLFQFTKQVGQNNFLGSSVSGLFSTGNVPASMLNRWQKPGDLTLYQKYGNGTDLSAYFALSYANSSDVVWSDASYIRLKNLSLSWQLPQNWKKAIHIQSCKLYIQGQNLLTITNYLGLDPETKSSTSLPPLRVITLGVKIGI